MKAGAVAALHEGQGQYRKKVSLSDHLHEKDAKCIEITVIQRGCNWVTAQEWSVEPNDEDLVL